MKKHITTIETLTCFKNIVLKLSVNTDMVAMNLIANPVPEEQLTNV